MNAAVQSRRLADGTLPQQIGVMSPILVGLDGVRRMGKSLGNYIGISESPYEMMKKFMQIPDGVMRMYFELLTDIPLAEVDSSRRASERGQAAIGVDGDRTISPAGWREPKQRGVAEGNRRRGMPEESRR